MYGNNLKALLHYQTFQASFILIKLSEMFFATNRYRKVYLDSQLSQFCVDVPFVMIINIQNNDV